MAELIELFKYRRHLPYVTWMVEIYDPDGNGTSLFPVRARTRAEALFVAYEMYREWAGGSAEPFANDLFAAAHRIQ